MLESFRKVRHTVWFKAILSIIGLAFLLSGAGLTRAHLNFSDNYLVKVGHERITKEFVEERYKETVHNIRRSGVDFTPEQLASYGISKEQILRTMIQDSLIRQNVNDMGLEIGDEVIADKIKSIPQFQTDGAFDREKFNSVMSALGKNEEQFTSMLRAESRNSMLLDTIASNAPVNDFIVRKQAEMAGETRDVEIVVIPKSFKPTLSEPTDKDLKDFYFENSYRFQIPESRDINYIKLPKSKDNSSYDLTTKIEDDLAGGSTLKEIADKHKLKLESKKELLKDDKDFSPLFVETAFGKEKGQISDLVSDEKNAEYFVIEVADVKPARIPELATVKEQVIVAWKENNANDQNLKYIEKMADELKTSSASLQSFAASNGYKYEVIKNIKRGDTENYGARLVNAAFDAKSGEVLGSFQNNDGTYKIAKLKDIRPAIISTEEQAKYKTQMAEAVRTEIMDEYFEALRQKYTIKRNTDVDKKVASEKDEPANIPNDIPQKK